MNLLETLIRLPGSYEGPTALQNAPYAVLGLGEGSLPAELLTAFTERRLTHTGTQFILASGEWAAAAADYASLAEASGALPVQAGQGDMDRLSFLVERGLTSTYHYAQYVAHATGNAEAAQRADALMRDVALRCAPDVTENNPARDLAWSLWGRVPLLLASASNAWLTYAWQVVLARVGKVLAVPVERDALYVLTGAFEARHENGDGRVALLLGDEDQEMSLAREVLDTRIDEVIHVPYFAQLDTDNDAELYAAQLAHWYFAAWVGHYVAERHGTSSEDARPLSAVLASLETATSPTDLN